MKLLYLTLLINASAVLLSSAQKQHPHGQAISFQLCENFDETQDSTNEKLKKIFGHPEVENRKVVILSIIGAYRKGKSFFLDYCLRFLYANYRSINTMHQSFVKKDNWWGSDDEPLLGFSWKHGSDPDTKGILFWSDVFLHEQNGEKVAIILIDTQGLFESGRDSNLDNKIFGVTNFISSIQVFNIRDVIQEDQLEHLKTVTEFAKLTTKRQEEKSLKTKFKSFQNLLFLFRDWDHEDVAYGYEGGKVYLEKILNVKEVKNMNVIAQSVRKEIKNSYDNINAFLLPSPGKIVRKNIFDGRWGPLDEDFKEHFITLIESIFLPQNLVKKKLLGNEIKAKDLLMFAISIFADYKGSVLPENHSIFDSTIKIQLMELSERSVKEYMTKISHDIDYTESNFLTKLFDDHNRVQIELIENFKKIPKMADEETENTFIDVLKIKFNETFYERKKSGEMMYNQYVAHKQQLDSVKSQLLESRREAVRRIYENTAIYKACRFFSMYQHDCGMSHNVNSVT